VKNKKINPAALEKIPQLWIVFLHAKKSIWSAKGELFFGDV